MQLNKLIFFSYKLTGIRLHDGIPLFKHAVDCGERIDVQHYKLMGITQNLFASQCTMNTSGPY